MTSSLPDTAANQAAYPQPGSQKPGLGFSLCRMVSIICLGSGALLDMASGPCKGKGSDEQTLLRSMLDTLQTDDVLLGDALYATYFLLCALKDKFDPLTHGSVSLVGGSNATANKLQTCGAAVDSLARSTLRIWLFYPPLHR